MTDKIQTAYEASKNIYDDVLTQGNLFSRLYIRLFWSGTDDRKIARKVLSYIPGDFSGTLLDVPVGTSVFTERKWARLKKRAHYLSGLQHRYAGAGREAAARLFAYSVRTGRCGEAANGRRSL